MGPNSHDANTPATYPEGIALTPDVRSRGRIITRGQAFLSRHNKCRDKWRCKGPGCIVRTGKTRRS